MLLRITKFSFYVTSFHLRATKRGPAFVKVNRVRSEIVNSWIVNNPKLIYDPASGIIFCTKCETQLKATFKRNIDGT